MQLTWGERVLVKALFVMVVAGVKLNDYILNKGE